MDVRKIREKLGMKQVDFARKLGVTITSVSRWENGHRNPDRRAIRDIIALIKGIPELKVIRDQLLKDTHFDIIRGGKVNDIQRS